MGKFFVVIGMGSAMVVMASQAVVAQDYDNPMMGEAPCVFLNSYEVEPAGGADDVALYSASATLENACGRSVEVLFCFDYTSEEMGLASRCFDSLVRPEGTASVSQPASPGRIAGPRYGWRYAQ